MNSDFYKKIENCSGLKKSRDANKLLALSNPLFFAYLLEIAFNFKDKHHNRAWWIIELVCIENINLFLPYLEKFTQNIYSFGTESTKRSVCKIAFLLTELPEESLNTSQKNRLVETCFDWLIEDSKVATKVYAMKTLFNLGKSISWVYPELKLILTQGFNKHSAAYKAAAKPILRQLN